MSNQSYKDLLLAANPSSSTSNGVTLALTTFENSKELYQTNSTPLTAIKVPDLLISREPTVPHFSCTKIHSTPHVGCIWYDPVANDLSYYQVDTVGTSFGDNFILFCSKYTQAKVLLGTNIPIYYNDANKTMSTLPNFTYGGCKFALFNGNNQLYIHSAYNKIEVRSLTTLNVVSVITMPTGQYIIKPDLDNAANWPSIYSQTWACQNTLGVIVFTTGNGIYRSYGIIKISNNNIISSECDSWSVQYNASPVSAPYYTTNNVYTPNNTKSVSVNWIPFYNLIFLSNAIIIARKRVSTVSGLTKVHNECSIIVPDSETLIETFYIKDCVDIREWRYFGRHTTLIKIGTDYFLVNKSNQYTLPNPSINYIDWYPLGTQEWLSQKQDSSTNVYVFKVNVTAAKNASYTILGTTIGQVNNGVSATIETLKEYSPLDGSLIGMPKDDLFTFSLLPYSSSDILSNRLITRNGIVFDIVLDGSGIPNLVYIKQLAGFANGIYNPIALMPSSYLKKIIFFQEKVSGRIYQLVMPTDTTVSDAVLIDYPTMDLRIGDTTVNMIYSANWSGDTFYMNRFEYKANVTTSAMVRPWTGINDAYNMKIPSLPNTRFKLFTKFFHKNGKETGYVYVTSDTNGNIDMGSKFYLKLWTPSLSGTNPNTRTTILYRFAPEIGSRLDGYTDITVSPTSTHTQTIYIVSPGVMSITVEAGQSFISEEVTLESYVKQDGIVDMFLINDNTGLPIDADVIWQGVAITNRTRRIKDIMK